MPCAAAIRTVRAAGLECATTSARQFRHPKARWPQLKVVRGGGSAPPRSAEGSGPTGWTASLASVSTAWSRAVPVDGSTAAGQIAAQSVAQVTLQQPLSSSWSCMGCDAAIGQSCDGAANAGPDDTAKASASQSRARRRRMSLNYSKGIGGSTKGNAVYGRAHAAVTDSASHVPSIGLPTSKAAAQPRKTLVFPSAPKAMTWNGCLVPLGTSIPGEPSGIPATAIPRMLAGLSARSRFTSSSGT